MPATLYDLSPAVRLLMLGGIIALVPFVWTWSRQGRQPAARRWRAITVLTLFLTFDLVLFGAFTRLTDSGLGCPDWPGCYGSTSPVGADVYIAAAEAAMPTGPVTQSKAWIEMVHRYIATALGALITATMVAGWVLSRRGHRDGPAPGWATATFVWVCAQGAFGAWTVTMKLLPAIVTLHLLGGYLGLVLLTVQVQAAAPRHARLSRGLRRAAWALFALIVLQSALGGWVSTNYAVLACTSFPACQGSWWPAMNFSDGFTIWRDLGMRPDGSLLPFDALTAIHYTHRLAAYAVLAAMTAFAWALIRRGDDAQRPYGWAVAALAAWQLASGLSNVVLDWPLVAALAHTGGAGAAIVVLTALLMRTRAAAVVAEFAVDSPAAAAVPSLSPMR